MPAVTLIDVARRAGVSLASASRVLNGSARVPRADVAERVRAAALALGYVPNAQAQALARSSTGLVGLVVHDIADPYFSTIAMGVQRAARARGRQVLLASTERDPDFERDAVAALVAHRADAIVLAGTRSLAPERSDGALLEVLDRYRAHGGRLAVIGQPLPGGHAVVPSNGPAARELALQLVAAGHRRFAVLTGPPDTVTARHRADGFAAGLAERGLALVARVPGDLTRDGGHAAALALVDALRLAPGGAEGPVCVFAVTDVMAVGAMAALRERGLRAPDDVAVAGFDDIPTLRDHVPPVTTVRLPLAQMGERALDLAIGEDTTAAGRRPPPPEPGKSRVEEVAGEVVLRESTRLVGPARSR